MAAIYKPINGNSNTKENFQSYREKNYEHRFIKIAKYQKLNSNSALLKTGFSNRDILSEKTFSYKSSVEGSSLNKNVNLIQDHRIDTKNNYDRLSSLNNASYYTYSNCDKILTQTNRSLTTGHELKIKFSEGHSSHNNFSSANRQEDYSMRSGNKMYQKGIASLERSRNNIKIIKEIKFKTEMKECTFQPKLLYSPVYFNINILRKTNIIFKGGKSEDYNRNEGNMNIEAGRERDIDRKSQKNKSANIRTSNSNKNLTMSLPTRLKSADNWRKKKTEEDLIRLGCKLYNHAEKSKMYKDKLAEEIFNEKYTFRPKLISSNSKPNIYNFFYRLQGWVDKRNLEYEQEKEKIKYDEKTGLRLFSPSINREKIVNEVLYI